MLKMPIVLVLFLIFTPAVGWACTCGGFAGNLNLALGSADHVVLARVEGFFDNGTRLSVQREFKGTVGRATILVWNNLYPRMSSCAGTVSQEKLGRLAVFLLGAVGEGVGGVGKAGDFHLLACTKDVYDVVENEVGELFIEGGVITEEGNDRLALDDLQEWVDDPERFRQLGESVQIERLMADPLIFCRPRAIASVKKGNEQCNYSPPHSANFQGGGISPFRARAMA